MKNKIILCIVILSIECLATLWYPIKQKELQQLEEEIQNAKISLKNLDYHIAHSDALDQQIKEKELKKESITAREQLIELFNKIETYPFQDLHYEKQQEEIKDNKVLTTHYSMQTVGHYNNILDLIEYIDNFSIHIYIKNFRLDHSIQNLNDPANLIYLTTYGDKLKDVYLITLDWIVDYESF